MKRDYIFFDLDGTLTDPKTGIINSIQYALRHFGMNGVSDDSLVEFIGPPLRETFTRMLGFEGERLEEAVAIFREYFSERGIYENALYPGIAELLERLRGSGFHMVLATSKVIGYAERILEHFGVRGYFDFIGGGEMDGRRSDKAEVIACALEGLGIEPSRVMMVGDRKYDVLGAAEHGIPAIGVLYGYGSREELTEAGAAEIVETVEELYTQLILLRD